MSVTTHERPGVYSSYDASSVVSGGGGSKLVGLVGINKQGTALVATTITSYEQGVRLYGVEDGLCMAQLIRLALANGAAAVVAVPVASANDYEAGFQVLATVENVSVLICDSTDILVQQKLRDMATEASAARRERIGVVGGTAGETVENLMARASKLNSERMVLTAPGGLDGDGNPGDGLSVAAAVAGAICGMGDPAIPLAGEALKGLNGLSGMYGDNEIDLLVQGGVTALESVGGVISVVRGITTKTTSGGAADRTWRELSTILIVDDVIPAIRSALRSKFRRGKNTQQGRGAIRAQVVLELENKLNREIISAYEGVTVTADEGNPTVCVVDFSFTVAHCLNQIWLTAHITV